MNKILLVILNYNGWQDTAKCLENLKKQSMPSFDIFLIDNASTDGSKENLEKLNIPNLSKFRSGKNLGFAGGVNLGIKRAIDKSYEYVVLLNNDAVLDKNWLAKLYKVLESKTDCGFATGLMLSADGQKIDSAGDACTWWGMPFPRFRDKPAADAPDSGYVFGATGGATIYRTTLFQDIGLFDEDFFAYFEDSDISLRAQLSGHKCYYDKSAVAYHDHGTTSSKIPGFTVFHSFKNLPIFLLKNFPASLLLRAGWFFGVKRTLSYFKAISHGNFLPATRGVFGFLGLLPKVLRERRKVQKSRRVGVNYIKKILSSKRM